MSFDGVRAGTAYRRYEVVGVSGLESSLISVNGIVLQLQRDESEMRIGKVDT